ncbi:MAG TPA: quinoprotein relay system zinc metallohydrolase 2 [Gammaproteobacteria bacterium]|nr:quinoprotein relay system zinc metallohydrolase 2 [Gammaproteobacteria bacterium]
MPAGRAAPLAVVEVAPGVYVHHGAHAGVEDPARGDIANIGFVVGERCVAVIDTGGSRATGAALREAIAATTSLPVCYVIDTHAHFDHVLGNAAFVADKPQFVGHTKLAAALDASRDFFAERFAAELGGPASEVVLPTLQVEGTRELDLGGRKLVLEAVAEAHTNADLTVYDAQTRTLWSGDLVFMERLPVLDGSLRGWLAWIDAPPARPIDRVVPGHGPVSAPWPAALAPERGYLSALLADARAAVRDGRFLEDVAAAAHAHPPAGWLLTEPHARNASKAFREVEWE